MACNGCGGSPAMSKEQIENLIQAKIDEGKIQGGLKGCDGEKLPAESRVILCSQLAEKVKELISNGTVDVVTDVVIEKGKLVVTDGTGNKVKTDLPYLKGVNGEKEVVLTLPDGSTVSVPKTNNVITKDDFDDTIEKGANKADKLGVRLALNKGLQRTLDGLAVKVGAGLMINEAGEIVLEVDISALKQKLIDLEKSLDAIPKHHADVLLVDGTGDVDLSYTHKTEEM